MHAGAVRLKGCGPAARSPRQEPTAPTVSPPNSLLEAVVYAARIADDIAGQQIATPASLPPMLVVPRNGAMLIQVARTLRQMMSANAGVVRDDEGLAEAVRSFAALEHSAANATLRNMATSALLVAASAWSRRESRGAHFRTDHPVEKPPLAHRTRTTLKAAREVAATLEAASIRTAQPMTA
jgi:L-aspartate oxidase